MALLIRPGIDHDPIRPWVWADCLMQSDPLEVVSYPIPHADANGDIDDRATIMVRTRVGDPTSIKEVLLKRIACFDRTRHEHWYRPKHYYSDNPTAFVFTDEAGRCGAIHPYVPARLGGTCLKPAGHGGNHEGAPDGDACHVEQW